MPIRLSDTLKKLLIVYVVVFILQKIFGDVIAYWFALIPTAVLHGKVWQVFTYGFLHVDVMHLVLNCLVLAFSGVELEAIWGTRKFLTYYFFCSTMAGVFYLILQGLVGNPVYLSIPLLGASGGIYGLLIAYGILFPDRELLFMMLFPMKAKQFVWVLAGVEFLQTLSADQGRLGSVAHLSGMGAGFLFLWVQAKGIHLKRVSKIAPKKKPANHLRLIKNEDEEGPRGPKTWH